MTYVIVYFGFPGMTTTWDNFSLLYVGESQSISEAYNSGLQTQLHKVQTVWMAETNALGGYPWENHAKGATVHITELAQTFHIGITWWSIGRYGISFVQASFFSFFQGGYPWTAKSTLKYVQILWFFEWQYFWQIVQQSRWNKILTNY